MFLIDPDFDVEYTIEVLPEYQEYLDQYYRAHGKYPVDYQQLTNLYKNECDAQVVTEIECSNKKEEAKPIVQNARGTGGGGW